MVALALEVQEERLMQLQEALQQENSLAVLAAAVSWVLVLLLTNFLRVFTKELEQLDETEQMVALVGAVEAQERLMEMAEMVATDAF
jgi:hypothetical protein